MTAVADTAARDRRRGRVAAVVIATAVVVVLVMAALIWYFSEDRGGTEVKADFAASVGLYPGSDVRMLGVKIGEVTAIEPQGSTVLVTMDVDPEHPAAADTEAVIYSPSLVSDRYVQLTKVWTSGAKLEAGDTIPADRTATPVELDQIYNAVIDLSDALGPNGANSQGALSNLLDVGAQNLGGNGKDFNNAIKGLSDLSTTFSGSQDQLFASISNLSTFTQTLADRDSDVASVNTKLADVSQVLSDERGTLATALQQLSTALGQVQGFIRDNRGALQTAVERLSTTAATLGNQRASLEQTLRTAPLLVSNFLNAYDPSRGLLVGRGNLNELSIWSGAGSAATSSNLAAPGDTDSGTGTTDVSGGSQQVQTATQAVTSVGGPPSLPAGGPPLLFPSAGVDR